MQYVLFSVRDISIQVEVFTNFITPEIIPGKIYFIYTGIKKFLQYFHTTVSILVSPQMVDNIERFFTCNFHIQHTTFL